MKERERLLLWPNGAPGAMGAEEEDCPHLIPFLLDTTTPRGLVIICPGGGYRMRAAHEADPIAEMINGHGMHAVVLHYRVHPYRHPHPLQDAQRAIRYVRAHAAAWHVDPEHIGILGFSAGGHLAAVASTRFDGGNPASEDMIERYSCRPDATVLCYAVISFQPFSHVGSRDTLLGPDAPAYQAAMLSTELCVDKNTPPAFLWHTAADTGVVPENSIRYAQALAQHGIPYELHIYQDGPHGLGLAIDEVSAYTWGDLCGTWLTCHGF